MNAGDELSARFAAALGCDRPAAPAPGALLGVEHEYELIRGHAPVDARTVLHSFRVPGLRLDPGDSHAYRLPSGAALTCDDAEVEVATPPIAVQPGAAGTVEQWAASTYAALRSAVPADYALQGTSTHLNFSMPASWNDRAALLFARRFAPAFMLLCDRRDSHGVYIRPRPGRLELCGDFVAGDGLRVVTTFALGAVRAISAALEGEDVCLPPALAPRLHPVPERYGLYADRDASFGCSLYREGRGAMLRLAGGGQVSARDHLAASWAAARAALSGVGEDRDVARLDAIAAGDAPLGIDACDCWRTHRDDGGDAGTSVYGRVLEQYRRPGFDVMTVCSTWDLGVFRIASDREQRYACVPAPWLACFFDSLQAGHLDQLLSAYLALPASGRVLARRVQTLVPGLFDGHGALEGLLAAERDPGPIVWVDDRLPSRGHAPTQAAGARAIGVEHAASTSAQAPSIASAGQVTPPASSAQPPARASAAVPPPDAAPARVAARPGKFVVERTVHISERGGETTQHGGPWRGRLGLISGGVLVLLLLVTLPLVFLHGGGEDQGQPASASRSAALPTASPGGAVTAANAQKSPAEVTSPTGGGATGEVTPSPASAATSNAGLGATPTSTAAGPGATATEPGGVVQPTAGSAATPTLPPTATPTTATASTPTTPPAVLSGTRSVTLTVESNPANHPIDLPPNIELTFLITRDRSVEPNAVAITVNGPGLPTMTGATVIGADFGSQGGKARASADAGTYHGFTTTYDLLFTISPTGVSGSLIIGGNGSLPGALPLVFSFTGGAPH